MLNPPSEVRNELWPNDAHRYRLMIESIRDQAIFSLDDAGVVTTWPTGAQHMFGYTPAEAIGQPMTFLHAGEARADDDWKRQRAQVIAEGSLVEERWRRRKDGSQFWSSGSLSALASADGRVEGFVMVLRDDLAPRVDADAVTQDRLDVDAANAAHAHYLARVSHQLRTPLMPILLWTKILDREQTLDPALLREGLETIRKCAEEQHALIDKILTTARSSRAKSP